MKRFGLNIGILILLAGFAAWQPVTGAHVQLNHPSPPCGMSMQMEATTGGQCHSVACNNCISCHFCAQCIGNVVVGQGISFSTARAGWSFEGYSAVIPSVYPPVDAPPPRYS